MSGEITILAETSIYSNGEVETVQYDHPDYPLDERPEITFVEEENALEENS